MHWEFWLHNGGGSNQHFLPLLRKLLGCHFTRQMTRCQVCLFARLLPEVVLVLAASKAADFATEMIGSKVRLWGCHDVDLRSMGKDRFGWQYRFHSRKPGLQMQCKSLRSLNSHYHLRRSLCRFHTHFSKILRPYPKSTPPEVEEVFDVSKVIILAFDRNTFPCPQTGDKQVAKRFYAKSQFAATSIAAAWLHYLNLRPFMLFQRMCFEVLRA